MPTRRPALPEAVQSRLRAYALALIALLASVTVVVTVTPGDPPSVNITVRTQAADGTPAPVTTPAAAVTAARKGLDDHAGARSEQPEGVTARELDAGREQQERLASRDDLPAVSPLAAPEQAGCTTRLVGNYSSRRGVAPRLWVIHYTVSPNRPGWSDVWAIASLFDRPAFQASSTYIVDREGHCAYIVRESDKAWTQAGFNPVSISVEVINSGREGSLMDAAGYRKLGRVISDSAKRWGIPLQVGAVRGCTVVRPGIVTHEMLGSCGGGHVDISPYSLAPVIEAAQRARSAGSDRTKERTKERASVCARLRYHRRKARRDGWTPERVQRVQQLRKRAAELGLDHRACRP